jgi:hypothetical protein
MSLNCSEGIIMYEAQIIPDFFDLKSGIAGEILQKFSNYDMRLAIIGDVSKYTSNVFAILFTKVIKQEK